MITLAIETSTPHGSVALLEDGRVTFSEHFSADRSLGSELFTCLRRARGAAAHCDRIAVGLGPGSYSGVRIAIAAAIGLEFAWKAEVVGIPSILALETLAAGYLSVGDARRSSYYYALIRDGECIEGPMLLEAAELDGAIKVHSALPVYAAAPIGGFPKIEICYPSAERLAALAEKERGICARGNLEPIYLRDPHITQAKKI